MFSSLAAAVPQSLFLVPLMDEPTNRLRATEQIIRFPLRLFRHRDSTDSGRAKNMRNGSYVVDDSFKRKKGPQVHFMNPVQASLVNIRVRVRPVNSRFGEGCGKGREVGKDEGERGR